MKNIWKLLMIALLAFAMIGCPATKNDDDDDNGTGGDGTPAISWWLSSDATTAETGSADAFFPYGFKFTTKAGWSGVYMAANMFEGDDEPDGYKKITLGPSAKSGDNPVTVSGSMAGPYDTVTFDSDHSNDEANYSTPLRKMDNSDKTINDGSSKIYLDESDLIPGALYTITFTPQTTTPALTLQDSGYGATVAFAQAASGATETNLPTDLANDDGTEIYISGANCGGDWASDTTTDKAHRMVKNDNGSYTYTYKSPDVTTTISLKLKFKDLSTDADFTYVTLTNVPVSMAGGEIEGSIFSWGGGTGAGVIAPKQGETTIVGGTLYEVTATAVENASWATDHVSGMGYTFAGDFHTSDATGAIMLSIGGVKKLVPYIKGQSKIFNWAVAKTDTL